MTGSGYALLQCALSHLSETQHMVIFHPDYPQIVLAFDYKGWWIEIDEGQMEGVPTFSAWANYEWSAAIAVPWADSRQEAIQRAKQWVDARIAK